MHLPLHKHITNEELGEVLSFVAGVLKVKNADRFRTRAYENAAVSITQLPKELELLVKEHYDLTKLPSIGKTLAEKIRELFTTGNVKALQKYTQDIPEGMWPLTQVHSIGPKTAFLLASTFHLTNPKTTLKQVKKLATSGKLKDLPGFGEKKEQEIIRALESHTTSQRLPYEKAIQIADKIIKELKTCTSVKEVKALGSLRRQQATVGDIDLGVQTSNISQVKNCVKEMKMVKRMIVAGEQLLRLQLTNNLQVDIKISPQKEWGAFLQHFTGSKEHNIKLREYALTQNKSLSEHGIKETNPKTKQKILKKFKSEKDFYKHIGLNWIPPAKRIGGSEIKDFVILQK